MKLTQQMIDRFLSWKLPNDFYPDHYINFDRSKLLAEHPLSWPIGTNLFTADQVRAMLEYVMQDTGLIRTDNSATLMNALAEIERLKAALNKYSEDEILLRKDAEILKLRKALEYCAYPEQLSPFSQACFMVAREALK
jgi:hypothetical protein